MAKKNFDELLFELDEKMGKMSDKMQQMEEKRKKIVQQKKEAERIEREQKNAKIAKAILGCLDLTTDQVDEQYLTEYLNEVVAYIKDGIEKGNLILPKIEKDNPTNGEANQYPVGVLEEDAKDVFDADTTRSDF